MKMLGGRKMRCAAIIISILSITVSAKGALFIGVNGETGPDEIDLTLNDTIIISVLGDGTTEPGWFYIGLTEDSPGSLDLHDPWPISIPPPPPDEIPGFKDVFLLDFSESPQPLVGLLMDMIDFHCEGLGDATVALLDQDWDLMDNLVVHQIPEPGMITLLGLGVFLLKRKRA